MPAKKKKTRSLTLPLICLVVILTGIAWLLSAKQLTDSEIVFRGTLDATVTYIGRNCSAQKIKKVPPCSGPYTNYFVRIFSKKNNTIVAANLTDSLGKILMNLPTGDYYFLSRENVSNNKPYRADFAITKDKRTYMNFIIDLGIR